MGKVLPKSTFGKTPQEKSLENNTLETTLLVMFTHTTQLTKTLFTWRAVELTPEWLAGFLGLLRYWDVLESMGLEAQIWILLRGLLLTFLWNTSVFLFFSFVQVCCNHLPPYLFLKTAPIFLSAISHDIPFYLIATLPPPSTKNPPHKPNLTILP